MLRFSSPSFGETGEGGGKEPFLLYNELLSPLTICVVCLLSRGGGTAGWEVVAVTAQVIRVCQSLWVLLMYVLLSRLCKFKTSEDLFMSFIFVYVVAKCYNSVEVFIYLFLFVDVLFLEQYQFSS